MSGSMRTITCNVFNERLMDFLEGDLDGATRADMEAHAHQCSACGSLLADLRRIGTDASRLPAITPSRDLWSGIASRIDAPVVQIADRRPLWKSPRTIGFAAAAAIVVAASLSYATTHVPAPTATAIAPAPVAALAPVAAAPSVAGAASTPAAPAKHSLATLAANRVANATPSAVEKSYDGEITGLRTIIKQRRGQLDSATVAVLERNLAVIDSAIAQCKTALAKDPNSQFLMQSLNQTLDTKVQILRLTAALPSAS